MCGSSKYNDRIFKYRLIDFGELVILGLCSWAFIMLLLVGAYMYHRADAIDRSVQEHNAAEKFTIIPTIDSADTTLSNSRLEVLQREITLLREERETYLSDLRQESNNIINKFNAWLGFWLGILTIFAGIVPIVIQYILRNKARREKEAVLEEIRQYAMIHKIEMCVSSICIDKENPVVIDSSNKATLINKLIYETNEDFGKLIALVDSHHGILEPGVEIQIVNALIQYCRLIDGIKKTPGKIRRRELYEILDQIKSFISELYSDNYRSRELIWKKLRNLHSKLLGLRYQ